MKDSMMWWYTLVISALWRLRQKDNEFKACLGYIVRSCLKKKGDINTFLIKQILREFVTSNLTLQKFIYKGLQGEIIDIGKKLGSV
jgi:hypothetical protein